jgi:hypothetical protein
MGANPTEADKKAAEGLIKVFGSIERLEGDLEASAQMASASLAVFPVQGSVLAQWNGLQKPSDYTVASRLPAGSWLMVSAGHFDLGPLQGFLGQLATAKGYPEVAAWLSLLGQESAVALLAKQDKTLRMAGLVAVTDGKKLAQLAADYAKKTAAKPPAMDSMDMSAKANAYRTGGSSLHAITLKPGAKMSADDKKEFEKIYGKGGLKTYFGVAGDWLIFSLDKDQGARSLAAKLVQGSKSKQPKSGLAQSFEKAVADSKARSESGVMVFDLGALAPDPSKVQSAQLALGIGFEGPVMRSRLTLPPDTLRFLVQQQMRGGQQPPP